MEVHTVNWKVLLIVLVICLSGCIGQPVTKESDKIQVVVTIPPQAEFVERVGGDRVQVTVMVPPGASPHTYEPTPGQLRAVSKAVLYAKVGSGIEFELTWMDNLRDANKDMVVVDCSQGIELIQADEHEEEHQQGYDPHIWLSPRNAVIMVETIYKGLVQVDPGYQEYYTRNKEAYIKELDGLDREISEALSTMRIRKIMVYHPAWAYFCRDYNLEQIPIEKEGKEPTPQGIAQLIDQAKTYNITIIFASPQFSTESAEVIAQEIGGKVILISSLEKEYVANMKKVAQAFSEV
jgi:zinc transport system substrate-binding protein